MRTLVWFRNDLRVADHPALFHAMDHGEAIGVFFLCARQWRSHDAGDNRVAFLLDGVHALAGELASLGVPLVLVQAAWFADVPKRLVHLVRKVNADALRFIEEYPLNERKRDAQVHRACEAAGIAVHAHHGNALMPPGSVLTNEGEPYTVFSPFKRRFLERIDRAGCTPLPRPRRQPRPDVDDSPLPQTLGGVPRGRVSERWPAEERTAEQRLAEFVDQRIQQYKAQRDFPAREGTSALSPYFSLGILSA